MSSPSLPTTEIGIPTMGPMAANFLGQLGKNEDGRFVSADEQHALFETLGLDLSIDTFRSNLERLMEVLLSTKVFLASSSSTSLTKAEVHLNNVVRKIVNYIIELCAKPEFSNETHLVLTLY